MPTEGQQASEPDAGKLARADPPSCRADQPVDAALDLMRKADWDLCVVLDGAGVVDGLLRREAARKDAEGHSVEDVMERGPKTFRPSATPDDVRAYLDQHNVDSVLVTNSDGELLGVVTREALKSAGK